MGLKSLIKNFPFLWDQYRRFKKEKKYRYRYKDMDLKQLKINIISPDASKGWIVYKFAKSVYDELVKMGYNATLSDAYDSKAAINHYFKLNNVGYSKYSKVDDHSSFMIAHVDTKLKLDQIKDLTDQGAIGVCMSYDTYSQLIAAGVRKDKLCYIHPAQDQQITPKKITLGFTYRIHDDNRKRDNILEDICKEIDPKVFKIAIMGRGWDKIVENVRAMGFEVEYYNEFDKQVYNELMPRIDYYCYFGFDEGSMGYLDAVAAGIGTIVTPQGYHKETECPITYPVNNLSEILDALHEIEYERKKHLRFVNEWTWENYTKKHIEIWKYMLGIEKLEVLLQNRGYYNDGIFSLLLEDLAYDETLKEKMKKAKDLD